MRSKKTLIAFIVAAVLIAAGFLSLYAAVRKQNNTPFTISYNAGNSNRSDVDISMVTNKIWQSAQFGNQYGAQYDGAIKNNMIGNISDWSLEIKLPYEGCVIDSSWNGTYILDGTIITLTPDEDINLIEQGQERTFGMVLYSRKEIKFDEFVFTGHITSQIWDYQVFWVLVVLLGMWLACLLVEIYTTQRLKSLIDRRKQDEQILNQTMATLAGMIDAKDEYTQGHSSRVAYYTVMLARKLGMDDDEIKRLNYIAMMHDCGKIGVPDEVLNKPGKLTDDEFSIIKSHTVAGGRILEHFTAIEGMREGALYHHERYDGKGYPEGLSGENIPYYARIICVADSFDAMNSDRCYRKRLKRDVILAELEKNEGTQFDPKIAKCMIDLVKSGNAATEE